MNKAKVGKKNRKQVIELVRKQVDASLQRYKKYKISILDVLEDGVRSEESWWYVPVQPKREPKLTSEYFEVLADIETNLLEDENLNVLLVPVLAES